MGALQLEVTSTPAEFQKRKRQAELDSAPKPPTPRTALNTSPAGEAANKTMFRIKELEAGDKANSATMKEAVTQGRAIQDKRDLEDPVTGAGAPSAIPQRAIDMGVDKSWTRQPQYDKADIYRNGNSFAGYGTMTPEQEAADIARGERAHANIMGIYARESAIRGAMAAGQRISEGRGSADDRAALQRYDTLMNPDPKIALQRVTNEGVLADRRLSNTGQVDVAKQQGANTLAGERERGAQAIELQKQGWNDPLKKEQGRMYGSMADDYTHKSRAPYPNAVHSAAVKAWLSNPANAMDLKKTQAGLGSINNMYAGQQGDDDMPPTLEEAKKDPRWPVGNAQAQAWYEDYYASKSVKPKKYAGGGTISAEPPTSMPMPDPTVLDYKRYALTATRFGATPMPFDQFSELRGTVSRQQAQPQSFAYGGSVEMSDEDTKRAAKLSALGGPVASMKLGMMRQDYAQQNMGDVPAAPRNNSGGGGGNSSRILGGSFNDYGNAPTYLDPGYSAAENNYHNALKASSDPGQWERYAYGGAIEGFSGGGLLKKYGGVGRQEELDRQEREAMGEEPSAQGTKRVAVPPPNKSYEQLDAEREAARQRMRESARPWYDKVLNRAEGGDIPPEYYPEEGEYEQQGAIPVGGRQVLGAGDGKSDSIPAVIDGERPAALSTGEFVMPVEAVQFFGLDRLRKMVAQSRKAPDEGAKNT